MSKLLTWLPQNLRFVFVFVFGEFFFFLFMLLQHADHASAGRQKPITYTGVFITTYDREASGAPLGDSKFSFLNFYFCSGVWIATNLQIYQAVGGGSHSWKGCRGRLPYPTRYINHKHVGNTIMSTPPNMVATNPKPFIPLLFHPKYTSTGRQTPITYTGFHRCPSHDKSPRVHHHHPETRSSQFVNVFFCSFFLLSRKGILDCHKAPDIPGSGWQRHTHKRKGKGREGPGLRRYLSRDLVQRRIPYSSVGLSANVLMLLPCADFP